VSTPRHPSPPDENPDGAAPDATDIFADLVPLDVVDGELVPRKGVPPR
jgi:hypothetical protein